MRRACILLAVCCGMFASNASAFQNSRTFHYPRVYGPTGHPYGPTQADYQYQRQYGRPWHGYGGQVARGYTGSHFNIYVPPFYGYGAYYPYFGYGVYDFPYAYGLTGTPGSLNYYGSDYSYVAPSYYLTPLAPPITYQAFPRADTVYENEALLNAYRDNNQRWNQPLDLGPSAPLVQPPLKKSSAEEQARSRRYEDVGDTWFRKQDYSNAYDRYKAAVAAASDRAEARFRLAYALTALGQYDRAVLEFKRGLQLEPTWPQTGEPLSVIFGEQNVLAKDSVLHKVVEWARADYRDPNRLFLLGVLSYFDGNSTQASTLFETAYRLAGGGEHLKAFLQPQVAPGNAAAAPQPGVAGPPPAPNAAGPQNNSARPPFENRPTPTAPQPAPPPDDIAPVRPAPSATPVVPPLPRQVLPQPPNTSVPAPKDSGPVLQRPVAKR